MKKLATTLVFVLLGTSAVWAQTSGPGAHFIENWDLNEDGTVTLDEAMTKRGDVFTAFDGDENGQLSPEEYAMFDEMRAFDRAQMQDDANHSGKGKGDGKGKGEGKGMGKGMMGGGEEGGMTREFNDTDGDGQVSREEFMSQTEAWITMMDRNGHGGVTTADFGG